MSDIDGKAARVAVSRAGTSEIQWSDWGEQHGRRVGITTSEEFNGRAQRKAAELQFPKKLNSACPLRAEISHQIRQRTDSLRRTSDF